MVRHGKSTTRASVRITPVPKPQRKRNSPSRSATSGSGQVTLEQVDSWARSYRSDACRYSDWRKPVSLIRRGAKAERIPAEADNAPRMPSRFAKQQNTLSRQRLDNRADYSNIHVRHTTIRSSVSVSDVLSMCSLSCNTFFVLFRITMRSASCVTSVGTCSQGLGVTSLPSCLPATALPQAWRLSQPTHSLFAAARNWLYIERPLCPNSRRWRMCHIALSAVSGHRR